MTRSRTMTRQQQPWRPHLRCGAHGLHEGDSKISPWRGSASQRERRGGAAAQATRRTGKSINLRSLVVHLLRLTEYCERSALHCACIALAMIYSTACLTLFLLTQSIAAHALDLTNPGTRLHCGAGTATTSPRTISTRRRPSTTAASSRLGSSAGLTCASHWMLGEVRRIYQYPVLLSSWRITTLLSSLRTRPHGRARRLHPQISHSSKPRGRAPPSLQPHTYADSPPLISPYVGPSPCPLRVTIPSPQISHRHGVLRGECLQVARRPCDCHHWPAVGR